MRALSRLLLVILIASSVKAQQNSIPDYVQLFRAGKYKEAVQKLRKVTKAEPSDTNAWHYLGLSYIKLEKENDAVKAFDKALAITPRLSATLTARAYALFLNNDNRAYSAVSLALEANEKDPQALYIRSALAIREGSYSTAYDYAKRSIDIQPNLSSPYWVKAQALISSFSFQTNTVLPEGTDRSQYLKEASADLVKFREHGGFGSDKKDFSDYLESMEFFAANYRKYSIETLDAPSMPSPRTNFKITAKPKASYSDNARRRGVIGTVRLLVGLPADGKVRHIIVLKPLGFGLDENAISAARLIKFTPASLDGKPVSSVAIFEYNFSLY
jgi:TonB family protein